MSVSDKSKKRQTPISKGNDNIALKIEQHGQIRRIGRGDLRDERRLAEHAGAIRRDARITIDPLVEWEGNDLRKGLEFLVQHGRDSKYMLGDKRYKSLASVLAKVLRQCGSTKQKIAIIEAITTLRADNAAQSPTARAATAQELVDLHVRVGLVAPRRTSIERTLKELAQSHRAIDGSAPKSASVESIFPHLEAVEGMVVPEPYCLTPDGVFAGPQRITSTPIVVSGSATDAHSDDLLLRLTWRYGQRVRDGLFPVSHLLSSRQIIELADKGVDVSTETAADLVLYLQASMNANRAVLPRATTVTQFGHFQLSAEGSACGDAASAFAYGQSILVASKSSEAITRAATAARFAGHDVGEQQHARRFDTAGSAEKWLEMARKACKYPTVSFVLAASFAAPLLSVLRRMGFVVSLAGPSSTGKTAVTQIAASAWGKPDEGDGIITSFNATANGLLALATVNRDMPLFVDDATFRDSIDDTILQNWVYAVANGRGKARATTKGSGRTEEIRTIAIATAEQSMLESLKNQGGLRRVIELRDLPFGKKSPDMAKRVRCWFLKPARENYGHAGPKFVRYVLNHQSDWPAWRKRYEQLVDEELSFVPADASIGNAIAAQLALVRFAAEHMLKVFQLPQALVDAIQSVRGAIYVSLTTFDKYQQAYDALITYIEANHSTFKKSCAAGSDGWIDERANVAYFYTTSFRRILQAETRLAPTEILNWLKQKQLLLMEKKSTDRHTVRRSRTSGGRKLAVYGIKLPPRDVPNFGLTVDEVAEPATGRKTRA